MSRIDTLWYGEGIGARTARVTLWPASCLYAAVTRLRGRLYDAGVLPIEAPALPTVSIGNLTVGGTGKTPVAAWLASRLTREEQARPALVLRGYGRDEVEVHRRLNPDIPVVVDPDRAAAIRRAKAAGADVTILDDGFQHRRIGRSADIVLLSAEQLLRPRRLLPAGPWREPLSTARRADLLLVTRKSASPSELEQALAVVRRHVARVPVAVAHLTPDGLVDVSDARAVRPLESLRGIPVLALAAIGEPLLFARQLEQLGARVSLLAYRDHHAYTAADIAAAAASVPDGGLALCTLKDAVKLAGRWPGPSRLWYVSQHLVVEQGAEEMTQLLKRALSAPAATTLTTG